MPLDPKNLLLRSIFGRWGRPPSGVEGYSVVLAMPMDMPFLLRFALEGLATLETTHCRQILVIPDGWGPDGGEGLRQEVAACGDPRVEIVELGTLAKLFIHKMGKGVANAANTCHWAMIVRGIAASRADHVFLHDADAFFVDADAIERQYRTCVDGGLYSLGVTARWDTFFTEVGYQIPATWELMVSRRWAMRHNPVDFKGQWRDTPRGRHEFDNLLYPEYLDYPSGKLGLLEPPPRIVHFNGAVTTFRIFKYNPKRPVVDELFRLLLLTMLEDLIPSRGGQPRSLPTVEELVRGLDDPSAPVSYASEAAAREYPAFRTQITEMCEAPIFQGSRAQAIRDLIAPFDRHFEKRSAEVLSSGPDPAFQTRRHGLG